MKKLIIITLLLLAIPVHGQLNVSQGGTGITTIPTTQILYGQSTLHTSSDPNFTWDYTNQTLNLNEGNANAFNITGTVDPSVTTAIGLNLAPTFQPTTASHIYRGLVYIPLISGSSNINTVTGILSTPFTRSVPSPSYSATTTNVIGYDFQPTWLSGTALNMYGYRITAPSNIVSAPIGNFYGISIDDITPATSSNYAIKTGLGTVSFGDKVGIGTTSPFAALSVVGASGVVADHYTATGTALSIFPQLNSTTASSTNLIVTGNFQLRNPANTFTLTVAPGAQTANRTWTHPVGVNNTYVGTAGAQSIGGVKTFNSDSLGVLGNQGFATPGVAVFEFNDISDTNQIFTLPDGGGTLLTENSGPVFNTLNVGLQSVNLVGSGNGFNIVGVTGGTGTKIGTATNQLFSFWNSTPIVQPVNTTAIDTLLTNTGLRASGGIANFDTTASSTNFIASSPTATSTFNGPIDLNSGGTSPTVGNLTLVGGTKTVTTGAATSNSFLLVTRKTSGGTIGTAITYTITNGSFTLTSDSVLDTSIFSWLIIN